MFLGDLVVITISALLLIFRSSYEPKLLFDISVAIVPFLLMWVVLAWVGNAYDLSLSMREFMKRNILLWFTSISLASKYKGSRGDAHRALVFAGYEIELVRSILDTIYGSTVLDRLP